MSIIERNVTNDSQFNDVDHRKLGILHFSKNLEHCLSRRRHLRHSYHSAPGYERATICISDNMCPRYSV